MASAHGRASANANANANELRILFVEDSPADLEMLLWSLRHMPRPIRHMRVASEDSLRDALRVFAPDIILSDFSMPGFGGQDALGIATEAAPGTPFVFVSGTIGEEVAIDALRRGAVDYVLKDNLRRLPAAIERALQGAKDRLERERMQRALAESEVRFRTIVETSKDWIWEVDCATRVTYCNDALREILGYAPEDVVGTLATGYLTDEAQREVAAQLPGLIEARSGWRDWRLTWVHRDGGVRVLDSTGALVFDEAGRLTGFRGISQDVTARLRHETKIRNLARIHAVLGALGNAVMHVHDRRELLLCACRAAVEHGGFRAAGIGERCGEDALRVAATFGDARFVDAVAPTEPMPIRRPGKYFDHPSIQSFRENRRIAVPDFADSQLDPQLRETMLSNGVRSQVSLPIGQEPWGMLALYSDMALEYDEEEVELLQRLVDEIDHAVDFIEKGERLEYLAYNNPLTGLPNAVFLHERLREMSAAGPVVLAAIEAPRLNRISSTRGKAFVHRVLRELAARLLVERGVVAHSESSTLLLAYLKSGSMAMVADRLDSHLAELERLPLELDGEKIYLGLRGGVACGRQGTSDTDTLEADAVTALANAHRLDVRVSTYTTDMRRWASRQLELERDLRHAVERQEFELHYQPKTDAESGQVTSAEALLRWRHPTIGLVPPGEFIPVLEETGLIVPVGDWVMREALATCLLWRRDHQPGFRIAVNVSARELRHNSFIDQRRALLSPWSADAPLDVEVTESVLMDDMDKCVPLLQALRDLGCQVAIDDFGTGYSSLNYLMRLPIDVIKIDRSFISALHEPNARALIGNIISLAHSLDLSLVAEGVEETEQAQALREMRCNSLQGYLLGAPVPAGEFVRRYFADVVTSERRDGSLHRS